MTDQHNLHPISILRDEKQEARTNVLDNNMYPKVQKTPLIMPTNQKRSSSPIDSICSDDTSSISSNKKLVTTKRNIPTFQELNIEDYTIIETLSFMISHLKSRAYGGRPEAKKFEDHIKNQIIQLESDNRSLKQKQQELYNTIQQQNVDKRKLEETLRELEQYKGQSNVENNSLLSTPVYTTSGNVTPTTKAKNTFQKEINHTKKIRQMQEAISEKEKSIHFLELQNNSLQEENKLIKSEFVKKDETINLVREMYKTLIEQHQTNQQLLNNVMQKHEIQQIRRFC